MTKILLVEDDREIVKNLSLFLKEEGFSVQAVSGQKAAMEQIEEHGQEIDLVLLDVSLEDGNGFAVCAAIKANTEIPVIFLTASGDEYSTVTGLDMGADDYITKPFNPLELIARVKSQLRRYTVFGNYGGKKEEESNSIISSGGLSLNQDTKEVLVDGESIKLTATEFGILELLLRNQGRVFSIDEIYENVWKEPSYNAENTVAVHIRRIREKIEINPKDPKYLKVVWGIGYKIEKY